MPKLSLISSRALGAVLLAGLAACGTPQRDNRGPTVSSPSNSYPSGNYPSAPYSTPSTRAPNFVEFGRVTGVEAIRTQEPGRGTGAGAVIGGVAGGVIGNQVGKGSGRDLARIAGVVGGAIAGNAIEKNARTETRETYQISVQVENGSYRTYEVPATGELRVGDRVRIQNNELTRL